jgi:hypothetical protein
MMIHSRFVRLLSILALSLLVCVPLTTHSAVAATHASSSTTVSGTVTIGTVTTLWTPQLGPTTLEGYSNPVTDTGSISGQGIVVGEWTLFANGNGHFTETATFFGTVQGRTGAFVEVNDGTTSSTGSFSGLGVITQGLGGLAGLRGTLTIQAINATTASYTGHVSFDPS